MKEEDEMREMSDGDVGRARAYRALEIMLSIFGIYPKHNKNL